ncbi:uncharacterized protein LOC144287740 isoform X3 [Canis aureus]
MLLLKYSSSTSSPDSASLEPYSQITGRLSHPASPSRSPKVSTSAGNCMYPTISSPQGKMKEESSKNITFDLKMQFLLQATVSTQESFILHGIMSMDLNSTELISITYKWEN